MFKLSSKFVILIFTCFLLSSCSQVMEVPKTIWGSSTRALEKARHNAITQSYQCAVNECFDAIMEMADTKVLQPLDKLKNSEDKKNETKKIKHKSTPFNIFLQDRHKQHIVVMGISDNVDTTEVGIFLNAFDENITHIDISSLSSSAKRKVADILFKNLQDKYIETIQ